MEKLVHLRFSFVKNTWGHQLHLDHRCGTLFWFPEQWSGRLEGGQEDKQFCLLLPIRYWLLWFSSCAKRVRTKDEGRK